ncbi:hypothetical protein D9M71_376240 [compost metagenome]
MNRISSGRPSSTPLRLCRSPSVARVMASANRQTKQPRLRSGRLRRVRRSSRLAVPSAWGGGTARRAKYSRVEVASTNRPPFQLEARRMASRSANRASRLSERKIQPSASRQ